MIWIRWIGLLAAASVAASSQGGGKPLALRISSGAQAAIGLDRSGEARLFTQRSEPLSAGETEMIQRVVRDHPDAFGSNAAPMTTDHWLAPIKPGQSRFRFVPFADGNESVLLIENGSARSYMYKARIGRGSKSMMTDVCQVLPGKRGVEHWPYRLDWIEVSDVQVIPYVDGTKPLCE